jgi:hypothetical protein
MLIFFTLTNDGRGNDFCLPNHLESQSIVRESESDRAPTDSEVGKRNAKTISVRPRKEAGCNNDPMLINAN